MNDDCLQRSPGKCDERTWGICLFHVVVNQTLKYNNNQYYADNHLISIPKDSITGWK
jgi:hypothetical protein